jgi:Ras-related GTP-binding protein C/D
MLAVLAVCLLHFPGRSGKSSIQKVVFQKTSPHDLMFLDESLSLEIKVIANNEFVQFQTWDFPGDYDFDSMAWCRPCFGPCAG